MFIYKRIFTVSLVPAMLLTGFILGPGNVYSQESAEVIEEVVVRGIRKSLQESLAVKQDSTNFVDAISAEDVGKLPDSNIAEALQRVAGVAIQRNRGEGDFVSIRGLGPEFVRSTVNGRTMLSATESRQATRNGGLKDSSGRKTNFDLLPSDIINSLQVVKSPSAEHVEGGMGGVVDVHTHRPLDLGNKIVGSAKGAYRMFNEDVEPAVAGLFSWVSEDEIFGWLGSVSYSERYIREDNNDNYGWCTLDSFCPPAVVLDTNGDGVGDLTDYVTTSAALPASYSEDRDRLTLASTLQWEVGDGHELTADVFYSERNIDTSGAKSAVMECCGAVAGWRAMEFGNVDMAANPDGSVTVDAVINDKGTLTDFTANSIVLALTDVQQVDDTVFGLGLNYDFSLSDWADLKFDIAYSEAEGEQNFLRNGLQTTERSAFDVRISGGQVHVGNFRGPDLSDISNYVTRNADSVERYNDDSEFAVGLDAVFAERVKLGVRYRDRTKEVQDYTTFNVFTGNIPAAGIETFHVGNFLDGDSSYPFGQVAFPDIASSRAYILANVPGSSFDVEYRPVDSYKTGEQTLAAYAQLELEGEIGSIPYLGNVGVRIIRTETDVTGYNQPFRIDNDPVTRLGSVVALGEEIVPWTVSSDYINVLPSLNLRFELKDNLFLRFSANKSLTRPTFDDLRPGLTVANPTNRIASAGNPELVAYESLNYDLGLEWYFADSSAVYVGAFWKQIDEFIGGSTSTNVTLFDVNFNSVTQPLNQGEAEIIGLEAGYQQAFDNGFGYILNATVIDSSAEFTSGTNDGQEIPFAGVSDYSYNLTGYYEKGKFQARLAWSYRSEFVLLPSDVFGNTQYVDEYGQLDASLSYFFNDNLTVFVSGLNLADEDTKLYSDSPDRPVSLATVGRRIEFGVRASF